MSLESAMTWAGERPEQLLILIPAFAFLECCLGIGIFVSGAFVLSISLVIYSIDPGLLPIIVALAFVGALAGDHLGFFAGYLFGPKIRNHRWLDKHQHKVSRVAETIQKSAPWTICIGRLSPPLRSLTPVIAGFSGIRPAHFVIVDLLACSIWATGLFLLVLSLSGINLF